MRKNEYIKTADFESQVRALKAGVRALKSDDEQKLLWMISRLERELVRFDDYQEIEVYDWNRGKRDEDGVLRLAGRTERRRRNKVDR